MKDDVGEVEEKLDAARTVYVFKIRGDEVGRLAVGNVAQVEKMEARSQTGWAWSTILGHEDGGGLSIENVTIFVWLARRASGEPSLSWMEFLGSWDDTVRLDEIEFAPVPVISADDEDADPQP